mgnify:FL=1
MKEQVKIFWEEFWKSQGKPQPELTDAFQFGSDAEWLARLVVEGKKTATCSGRIFYELENESLPQVGQYFIVLNSKDLPVAIIQITEVSILPMNEVPVEFALAEGAGDYDFWWNAHKQFLTNELQVYGLDFSEDMPLVCERFKVIYTV